MNMVRRLWQQFLAWRGVPGPGRPAKAAAIKKFDIPDEEMGQFQRGLGLAEGSEGSG